MVYLGKLTVTDIQYSRTWYVWGATIDEIFYIRYGISSDINTAVPALCEKDLETELQRLLFDFAEISVRNFLIHTDVAEGAVIDYDDVCSQVRQ